LTFRDELIEAGARQLWTWFSTDERGSWEDARFPESWRERARSLLATWEAHRTTEECPTCGGTGHHLAESTYETADLRIPCPAGCIDGRVPRDSPRLAVVEQYGKAWDHNRFTNELIGMDDDGVNRLYRLAPDLHEETETP